MRLFQSVPDGGAKSGVTAHFLIESKRLGSIALLHFDTGTRSAYHTHAFNAVTLWLKGAVVEHQLHGETKAYGAGMFKLTRRSTFHKVEALRPTWALTFRGPWVDVWQESRFGKLVRLTHGRVEV